MSASPNGVSHDPLVVDTPDPIPVWFGQSMTNVSGNPSSAISWYVCAATGPE